jgi:hypothetical protein
MLLQVIAYAALLPLSVVCLFNFNLNAKPTRPLSNLKTDLLIKLKPLQKNGKDTPINIRNEIDSLASVLEKANPTKRPALSEKVLPTINLLRVYVYYYYRLIVNASEYILFLKYDINNR